MDTMAAGAVVTLRDKFGLEPGVDCLVAGYDNLEFASWPCFSLTTYAHPVNGIVDETVRIIMGQHDAKVGSRVVVPSELVVRRSA